MKLKFKKCCPPAYFFVSILFTVSQKWTQNGKFSLSTIVFEHKLSNKLSSLILLLLEKARSYFQSVILWYSRQILTTTCSPGRGLVVFWATFHPELKRWASCWPTWKESHHSMMLNELCSGYSSKFSDNLVDNLAKLWILSFLSSLLEVFKLSSGLAHEELQLCYILLEKKPRICRQNLSFWRAGVLCIQMKREKISQCPLSYLLASSPPHSPRPQLLSGHCHQLDEWSLHRMASCCLPRSSGSLGLVADGSFVRHEAISLFWTKLMLNLDNMIWYSYYG